MSTRQLCAPSHVLGTLLLEKSLVVYFRSLKSRQNPRAECAKQEIRLQLRRSLTEEEEHLIDLSGVILDSDDEQLEEDHSEAA